MKPTRFIDSMNCAIEGILYTARTQKHMRSHFLAALLVLVLALFLRISALEFTLLAVSIAFVLFAELANTAIEVVVDLVSPEYHPLAKTAKDVAAGGVLVAAIGGGVTGYLVLSRYLFPIYKEGLGMMGNQVAMGTPTEMGTLVSILMVVIVVVIMKSWSGKGSPLEGGMPSGHAAVAFAIATAVSITTQDPITSILAFALALMVSHSRLLLRIHSMREVILGAVVGTGITLLMLLLFKAMH